MVLACKPANNGQRCMRGQWNSGVQVLASLTTIRQNAFSRHYMGKKNPAMPQALLGLVLLTGSVNVIVKKVMGCQFMLLFSGTKN